MYLVALWLIRTTGRVEEVLSLLHFDQGFIQKFWLGVGEIKCMLGGGGGGGGGGGSL